MPSTMNSAERAEFVSEVVTRLLADGGQAAVTTRAIAGATGLGWQSLVHHFGGRRRLMSVSCHLAGRAHIRRLGERLEGLGVGGVVPDDKESLALDRAWLAWTDLARFDDHLSFHVADTEACETFLLGRALGDQASSDDIEILAAAARGLRSAVCRLEDPMPPADARRLLDRLGHDLTREATATSA